MGYYTKFSLHTVDPETNALNELEGPISEYIELHKEKYYGIGPNGSFTDTVKWYDYNDDDMSMP